jgi:hypothetical protein
MKGWFSRLLAVTSLAGCIAAFAAPAFNAALSVRKRPPGSKGRGLKSVGENFDFSLAASPPKNISKYFKQDRRCENQKVHNSTGSTARSLA